MIPNENTATTDKNKNIPNTVNNNVKNKNILDASLLANNNNNLINTVTTTSDITDAIKQQKGKKQADSVDVFNIIDKKKSMTVDGALQENINNNNSCNNNNNNNSGWHHEQKKPFTFTSISSSRCSQFIKPNQYSKRLHFRSYQQWS